MPRVRQGIFRTVVADVYGRQCAVTREKAFPALEAAHIRSAEDADEDQGVAHLPGAPVHDRGFELRALEQCFALISGSWQSEEP